MKYYSLAASLPYLQMDAHPPMSMAAFRRMCADWLSPEDLRAFDHALQGASAAPSTNRLVEQWRQADTGLRASVARTRASRLKCEIPADAADAPWDAASERAVADAFSRPTPLDREMAIDRFRWAMADELAGFDTFGMPAIIAYGIKLGISQRWAEMDADKGMERMNRLQERKARDSEPTEEQE